MTPLQYWLRIVGVLYLVLGIGWLPPLTLGRLTSSVPGWEASTDGAAARGFADYMLLFSLDLLVLGAVLLWASTRPGRHTALVVLVVGLSLVRGIADDVYMIVVGYPVATFAAFIVLHAVVATSGVLAWRRSAAPAGEVQRPVTA